MIGTSTSGAASETEVDILNAFSQHQSKPLSIIWVRISDLWIEYKISPVNNGYTDYQKAEGSIIMFLWLDLIKKRCTIGKPYTESSYCSKSSDRTIAGLNGLV